LLARLSARAMRADSATVVAFSLTERPWRTLAEVEADLHARLDTAPRGARTADSRLLLIDAGNTSSAVLARCSKACSRRVSQATPAVLS